MLRMLRYALLCLVVLTPLSASADGYTEYDTIKIPPSNLTRAHETFTFENYVGCFDYDTGNPITCTFSYKVLGLAPPAGASANNGGHLHDLDTHPLIWPADGKLLYNLTPYPPLTGIPSAGVGAGLTTNDAGTDQPGYAKIT